LDDAAQALVATVVMPAGPEGEFDYLVPAELIGNLQPEKQLEAGRRIRVPFGRGNRSVVGYCVSVATKPTGGRKLKSVVSVVDRQTLIPADLLRIAQWMAARRRLSQRDVPCRRAKRRRTHRANEALAQTGSRHERAFRQ
jgi:primosomal protein N' (replication factor Y)